MPVDHRKQKSGLLFSVSRTEIFVGATKYLGFFLIFVDGELRKKYWRWALYIWNRYLTYFLYFIVCCSFLQSFSKFRMAEIVFIVISFFLHLRGKEVKRFSFLLAVFINSILCVIILNKI